MAAKPRRFQRNSDMPGWTKPGHALADRPRQTRGWPAALAALVLLAGATLLAARLDPLPPRFTGEARASDGDSLRLGADRIRLLGIDAPELDQVCWRDDGTEWPCGRAARDHLAALLSHGDISCATDGQDKFGRFLATCENAMGEDLGASQVENGFVLARDGYPLEDAAARAARRGIWNGRFTDPRQWRDEGPREDPGPSLFEQVWTWLRELTGARSLR